MVILMVFVKVIFDAKYGEWLGCHMIGTGVTELVAEAVVARRLETTGHEIIKSIHPHPTLSGSYNGSGSSCLWRSNSHII